MSLWHFLSELLHCRNESELYSSDALSSVPHLAHLLLREVECGILISALGLSEELKSNFRIKQLLWSLTRIVTCPDIDPKIKARALVLRVLERCHWRRDEIIDRIDNKPASEKLKEDSLSAAVEAWEIANQLAFPNTALYELTLAEVKGCLGRLETEAEHWTVACTNAKSLQLREDLYFATVFPTARMTRALYSPLDCVEIQAVFTDISERYAGLGEFGKLLVEIINQKWKPILEIPRIKEAFEAIESGRGVLSIQTFFNIVGADCELGENKGRGDVL